MSRVSFKGVIIGGIVDVVSSSLSGIPLVGYIMSTLDLAHTPKDQIQAAVMAAIHTNSTFHILQLSLGLACSILGGYVAAWLAKHDELLNGALSAFLCSAIGIYSLATGKEAGSLLQQILVFIGAPLFALLGGYLRLVQVRIRMARV